MTEHRIDCLISRIVDKAESPEEWAEFRTAAAAEPSIWELLAEAQRDNERMAALAATALAVADRVDLPGEEEAVRRTFRFRRPISAAAGWVAAACLLLAWIATGPAGLRGGSNSAQSAGFSLGSADEALQAYIDKGQADGVVVGELEPKMLLDSRQLPSGALEVVFIRQIIERRQVPTLVRFQGTDERGRAQPVVVRPGLRGSM